MIKPDSMEVTVEDLSYHEFPYLSLAGWLTWPSNEWHVRVLNRVCQAGLEHVDELADMHSLTLSSATTEYQGKSVERARSEVIECAVRLVELPLNSPIRLEVHALMDSLNFGAETVRFAMGEDYKDLTDIDQILGLEASKLPSEG